MKRGRLFNGCVRLFLSVSVMGVLLYEVAFSKTVQADEVTIVDGQEEADRVVYPRVNNLANDPNDGLITLGVYGVLGTDGNPAPGHLVTFLIS